MRLDFGQPLGGVVQTAYVVPDIREAMARWAETLKVGPWFLFERFAPAGTRYRGEPTEAGVALAMAFAGHMQIELIQPLDDLPTVYTETIAARGHGFHHWGIGAADVQAEIARYEAMGFEKAWTIGEPGEERIAYMDSKGMLPGFVEIFDGSSGLGFFTDIYKASVGWNGADPVRPAN
jgi:hypothetical protein